MSKLNIVNGPSNPNLKDCVIFDLDGTLAIFNNRGPHDYKACINDSINYPVFKVLKMLVSSGIDIIFLTGREESCVHETMSWIGMLGLGSQFKYKLYMRPTGSKIKDNVVKETVYNKHIKDKYNVLFIMEDRQRVVEMWRKLGLTVFQVDEGNF